MLRPGVGPRRDEGVVVVPDSRSDDGVGWATSSSWLYPRQGSVSQGLRGINIGADVILWNVNYLVGSLFMEK